MKITYTPTLENYIQYQLYKYSLSKQKKRQTITLYAASISCFLLCSIFIQVCCSDALPVYLALAGLYTVLWPFYYRRRIKKHYYAYAVEHLTAKTKKPVVLEIVKDFLSAQAENGDITGRIKISVIQQITEVAVCYFLELDGLSSYILPKNPETEKFVRILTEKYGVKFIQNLRWKW